MPTAYTTLARRGQGHLGTGCLKQKTQEEGPGLAGCRSLLSAGEKLVTAQCGADGALTSWVGEAQASDWGSGVRPSLWLPLRGD